MSTLPQNQEILRGLATLVPAQKHQVLEFVRFLAITSSGVPGQSLLPFASTISSADLDYMKAAIDEACEQVGFND
jgi:hypothetical protein